jgi:RHS repeat-associated protein
VAVGGVTLYDPFGNALTSLQADSPDGLAYGFEGKHGIDTDTDAGGIVLMGARLYDPATGRFLQVDPVFGGSCSAYDYVCKDPVNASDLAGTSPVSTGSGECAAMNGHWEGSGPDSGHCIRGSEHSEIGGVLVGLGVVLGVVAAATGIGAVVEGSAALAFIAVAAGLGSAYLDGKSCFGGNRIACAGLIFDAVGAAASRGAALAAAFGVELLATVLTYFGINVGLAGLTVDGVGLGKK